MLLSAPECIQKGPNGCAKLAVLVRVKNEIQALPEFWRRLSAQTCLSDCEIVFLDSGSTDGTLEFLSGMPCSVWTIPGSQFQFGSSCNTVMTLSTAPVALLISGHVLLSRSDDLERIVSFIDPRKRMAAYLRQVPNNHFGSNAYERAYLQRRFPGCSRMEALELSTPGSFSNAASVITRVGWLDNPFPEVCASEDFVWAQQHLGLGGRMFYLPQIEVLHSHDEPAQIVFKRVRINVDARGLRGSYRKAALYCAGIFGATLRHGASLSEAWDYASAHAKAYL